MLTRKSLAVLMATLFLCISGNTLTAEAFDAKGNAIVPGLFIEYISNTDRYWAIICISNTTSETVTCKVTVYDGDGYDITNIGTLRHVATGSTQSVAVPSTNGEFDLPPLSTRMFSLYQASTCFYNGHAVIEWNSSQSTLRKALVATRIIAGYWNGVYSQSEDDINGGQIF